MVWGKLLGGMFGFLVGGPLGAVLGAALGHNFDRGLQGQLQQDIAEDDLSPGDADRIRMAFFTATFSVMGHIAKADGRVEQSELDLAEAVMARMSLTPELRSAAIKLFNEGKQPHFELEPLILQFRQECQRRTSLYRIFLEIQIQAAYADGVMAPAEEKVLLGVADVLGFSEFVFRQLETLVRFSMGLAGGSRPHDGYDSGANRRTHDAPPASANLSIKDAYELLGVDSSDDKAAVKRAYRRLMSQHHPDKLIAKGLPEEMIELATDKTQNIQKAYERVKEARGW